jgi:phospholipid transport system substrate-binding protein
MVSDRRFFIGAAVFLMAFGPAEAQESQLVAPEALSMQEAVGVVKRLQDGMAEVVGHVAELNLRQRFDALRPAIGAAFDLPSMARICYGPGWDDLSGAQRAEWEQAFGDYVAASYAARFDGFNGKGFERDAKTTSRGGEIVVSSRVILTEGAPVPIDYVMRQTAQGWRVGDILANGSISELAQWRRALRGLAAGGDFTSALAGLRQRRDSFLTQ